MKYGSKTASKTLIGAESRSGRVETVETKLKKGEPSRTVVGSCRRAHRSVTGGSSRRLRRAEPRAPPTPLCDTWQQQSESRRAVELGRSAGHNLVRVGVWVAGGSRLGPRLIVEPWLTGLGRKCLGCRPTRLDCGSGLGLVQLNRNSQLVLGLGCYSWVGPKAEAEGKNGLALSSFGFGLTRIRRSRLPYPSSADFSARFLSSSFFSLFVVLLSFLGVLQPKSS